MYLPNNYSITAETIARGLNKSKRIGPGKYHACCPAHDDNNPSLSITDKDNITLVKCWSGCSQEAVINTLRDMELWHSSSQDKYEFNRQKEVAKKVLHYKTLLAIETAKQKQGYIHNVMERAQIQNAINYLKEHGYG